MLQQNVRESLVCGERSKDIRHERGDHWKVYVVCICQFFSISLRFAVIWESVADHINSFSHFN